MNVKKLVYIFTLLLWLVDTAFVFCCWKLKEAGWLAVLFFLFNKSYRLVRSKFLIER